MRGQGAPDARAGAADAASGAESSGGVAVAAEIDAGGRRAEDAGASGPGAVGGRAGQSAELARILRIRVPVIAELARRKMSIGAIRRLSPGTIIEFERDVSEPLELLVNNRGIGRGEPVRVGENFGVCITQIAEPAARIRSMGRGEPAE